MDILFLPKYGPQAASCRYRFLQYIPFLEQAGMRCTVSPLFDDAYLLHRFRTGRARPDHVAAAVARRTRAILGAAGFDLVVLAYEALPYLPALPERSLRWRGVPYICDYDDAIFHQYERSPLVRRLLGGKIRQVMAGAELVLCGSRYLADYARAVNPRVAELPTVIDLMRYPAAPVPDGTAGRPFTIGWIGSPSTAAYLPALRPALLALSAEAPVKVVLIGAGAQGTTVDLPGVPLEVRPWHEDTEVADLMSLDVGVMPLPDTPWARGKCGFKLIQYMACGLPVVASPVGANRDLVADGENGFLCDGPGEWLATLRRLRDDTALRRRLGQAGREAVTRRYCLQVTAPQLVALLRGRHDLRRRAAHLRYEAQHL